VKKRYLRNQLGAKLRELGYPISDNKLIKMCAPSVNQGPPIDGYWGRRPLYTLEAGIDWAESLVRSERRALQQRTEQQPQPGA
jgi:hypothetical protein